VRGINATDEDYSAPYGAGGLAAGTPAQRRGGAGRILIKYNLSL
jgi:hypothetical protein